MSLTELLVATILIGIVMVGVASFSSVVKQLQSTTDRSTILHLKTSAAMSFIRKDALLATGDPSSPGIEPYNNGTVRSICFRQDVNDPTSYAEDIWVCYGYGGTMDKLKRCYDVPPANVPVQNEADCNAAAETGGYVDYHLSDPDFFTVVNDADGRLQYIQITLAAVYDETAPAHPVTNPEYVLTAQISPPHHGR